MTKDEDFSLSRSFNPKRVGHIFFDLDGTVINSFPGIEHSIQTAFTACGRVLPIKDLRSFVGPSIREILMQIDARLTKQDLEMMENIYRQHYDTVGCLRTLLYPGVRDTLNIFTANNIQMFIITNKPKLPTVTILKNLHISQYFLDILCRDSRDPPFSSKTEMLHDLMPRHDIDPLSSLMVGDTEDDWRAASECSLSFIHAGYGYGSIHKYNLDVIYGFPELLTRLDISNTDITSKRTGLSNEI